MFLRLSVREVMRLNCIVLSDSEGDGVAGCGCTLCVSDPAEEVVGSWRVLGYGQDHGCLSLQRRQSLVPLVRVRRSATLVVGEEPPGPARHDGDALESRDVERNLMVIV